MQSKKYILAIVSLAFFIRIFKISTFPIGFTQDEAGLGYDAYSLLKTGKDMWGNTLPLTLRSFGDFKLPIYTYLAIPSIFIFGLNEFAVRLPSAIFGTLAVVSTYLMVYELSKRKDFALISATFLAISSWHISLSRGAYEANLTTFFIPTGVWGFLRGLKNSKLMVLASFAFGLNLFTYHSARFFTPLILLLLIIFSHKEIKKSMNQSQLLKNLILKYKYSILICLIFLFAVFYTMFTGANTRAFDITIFNPTDKWQAMSERRYEAIVQGVPSSIARLFSNKITFIFKTFVTNYVGYLSPEFLFTKGVSESSYGMVPGRGVLYLFEIIPIAAFLYSVIRKESFKGANFLLVWILLSPTLAALTKGLGYSGTRAAIMMPAIQILSAYGLVYLFDCLRGSLAGFRKLFIYSLAVVLLISVVSFLEDYYFHAPARSAKSMSYGMKQTINYINDVESKYDRILISRSLSVPHIWISFFNKIDPKVVQKAAKNWIRYEKEGLVSVDQLDEYQLGKYIFGDIYYDERKDQKNTLFIGRPEDFSVSARPSKIIYYPNGEPAYLVAESIN